MNKVTGLRSSLRDFYAYKKYDYPLLFLVLRGLYTIARVILLLLVLGAVYLFARTVLIEKGHVHTGYNASSGNVISNDAVADSSTSASSSNKTDTSIVFENALFRDVKVAKATTTIADLPIAKTIPLAPAQTNLDSIVGTISYLPSVQWTNVRSQPNGSAEIVTSLSTATEVQIVATAGDWVRVQVSDRPAVSGYVYRKLLTRKN